MPLQRNYAKVVFNVTQASSVGTAGFASLFAQPPSGSIVNSLIPTDVAAEIVNDVEWLLVHMR